MSVVGTGGAELHLVGRRLDAGVPVVLPMPRPMAYVLAGADPAAVNEAKGRPGEQTAGVAVARYSTLRPHLDLDDHTLDLARWLTAEAYLNLLLPVTGRLPGWLVPSTRDGWLGMTLAFSDAVRPLLDERDHLYLSSANVTGTSVACDAATADAAFGGRLVVVDGDGGKDGIARAGSGTMVKVRRGGKLEVVRDGVQNAADRGDPTRFLGQLLRRRLQSQPG
jgi:L-threonylcarbamoyladenylate synthase